MDQKNSGLVFDKFKELCSGQKQTLLIVNHDPEFTKKTDRILEREDGKKLIQQPITLHRQSDKILIEINKKNRIELNQNRFSI